MSNKTDDGLVGLVGLGGLWWNEEVELESNRVTCWVTPFNVVVGTDKQEMKKTLHKGSKLKSSKYVDCDKVRNYKVQNSLLQRSKSQ